MSRKRIERNYDDKGNLISKQCTKCGQVKDINEFYKYSKVIMADCKECHSKKYKKSRERKTPEGKKRWDKQWKQNLNHMTEEQINQFFIKNMIRIKKGDTVLIKRCFDCMEYKMVSEFSKRKREKDGLRGICNECMVKRKRKWGQTPKGKESNKRATNKRRAKKKGNGGSYTSDEWNQCLDYFNHCDAYTGEPLTTTEIEHIIPISKGGTTYIYNIVPANKPTNCSKGKKELWEWYSKQPYFSWDRYLKICLWIIKNLP